MKKKILNLCLLVALLVGATAVMAYADASTGGGASDIGSKELTLVQSLITGSVGAFFGLLVAFCGVYVFIVKGSNFGIILIILGVAITFLPSIYNGVRVVVCPIAKALSSDAASCKANSGSRGGSRGSSGGGST